METAKKIISNYVPYNEQEENDKKVMLYLLDNYNNLFTRENLINHFTSSSWILNEDYTKVLMIYHNIYDSWSWTGGHNDGDTDFFNVALKEAKEETGVKKIYPVSKNIFSLDIAVVPGHVKREKYVSSHLHLNITYLFIVNEKEKLFIKPDENSGIKWFPINEVNNHIDERDMIPIYTKLNEKVLKRKIGR